MKSRYFLIAATAAMGLLPVTSTFAAKSTAVSSIQLSSMTDARMAPPALGSMVTFDSVYAKTVGTPRIEVDCYQSGALVYGETGSADWAVQSNLTGVPGFVLGGAPAIAGFSGGSIWANVGGTADCTATLFFYSQKAGQQTYNVLARTSFPAAG